MVDANLKQAVYERMGVLYFWLLDPDPVEPSLTARELDDEGQYQTVARVKGEEAFHTERPFPVRIVSWELGWRVWARADDGPARWPPSSARRSCAARRPAPHPSTETH
jgi:hypothetical protein